MRSACTTPELPVVGCPVDAVPGATPAPTPAPTEAPAPRATTESVPSTVAEPAPAFTPAPAPVVALAPPVGVVAAPVPTPVPTVDLAVPAATGAATVQTVAPVATTVPITTAVSSAYGIVVFGVIGVALLVSFLSGLRPAAVSSSAPPLGGTVRTQRTRLWAGLTVIAAAAVVGGIGWYRISGEPLLNRQIPFLASAGIAVVVLAVLGGALVVAEQLRADQNRIGELESAVRALTEKLSPLVEQPARRTTESDVLVQ